MRTSRMSIQPLIAVPIAYELGRPNIDRRCRLLVMWEDAPISAIKYIGACSAEIRGVIFKDRHQHVHYVQQLPCKKTSSRRKNHLGINRCPYSSIFYLTVDDLFEIVLAIEHPQRIRKDSPQTFISSRVVAARFPCSGCHPESLFRR